jgi:predicted O-methyltransferase YrrM
MVSSVTAVLLSLLNAYSKPSSAVDAQAVFGFGTTLVARQIRDVLPDY